LGAPLGGLLIGELTSHLGLRAALMLGGTVLGLAHASS
jgi:hypothetical protein